MNGIGLQANVRCAAGGESSKHSSHFARPLHIKVFTSPQPSPSRGGGNVGNTSYISGHGDTSIAPFGISPKLSGAYIASTRDGGNANLPGLFKRTVYSTVCLPRGRYSK